MPDLATPTATDLPLPAARSLRVFKRVRRDGMTLIKHEMHTFPSVDVYELPFFDAVVSADEESSRASVQFYVYHTSDGSATVREDGQSKRVTVEEPGGFWRIPFEEALRMAGVEYDDETHLGDVVTDFWSALFSLPSDPFDETSWGVSPWLERNAGAQRTVSKLRSGGEWDDLWLQFRPRKTIYGPMASAAVGLNLTADLKTDVMAFIESYHTRALSIVTSLIPTSAHQVTTDTGIVGSSRVDLQACKLEYSIVSPK